MSTPTPEPKSAPEARPMELPAANPFARRVAELHAALVETVTKDDIRRITAKLVEQASDGGQRAARLVYAYALGRPQRMVHPDRVDQHEWQLHQAQPAPAAVATTLQSAS